MINKILCKCNRLIAIRSIIRHIRAQGCCEINIEAFKYKNKQCYCVKSKEPIKNAHIELILERIQESDIQIGINLKDSKKWANFCNRISVERKGFNNTRYRNCVKATQKDVDVIKELWISGANRKEIETKIKQMGLNGYSFNLFFNEENLNIKKIISKCAEISLNEYQRIVRLRRGKKISEGQQNSELFKNTMRELIVKQRSKILNFGFPPSSQAIKLFRELIRIDNDWILENKEVLCDYYGREDRPKWQPDIYHKTEKIVIECDGFWVHGPILEKDSNYIKKSKKAHHFLDESKNQWIDSQNDVLLIRTWSEDIDLYLNEIVGQIFSYLRNGELYENSLIRIYGRTRGL